MTDIYVALIDGDGMGRYEVVYAGEKENEARRKLAEAQMEEGNSEYGRIEEWRFGRRIRRDIG